MNRAEKNVSRLIRSHRRIMAFLSLMVGGALLLAGCGSGKTSVKGYDPAALSGKRVFVLLPAEGEVVLANPDAFAASRGIGEAGGPGRISTEFRTDFPTALNARMDSNTILEYGSQSVGAMVPLNPATDLPKGGESSWNWSKVKEASKQGNIDYLLVIHEIRVQNEMPKDGASRGKETVTASFSLIDPAKSSVMTGNEVTVSIKDPRKPGDTYTRLAEAISKKLPFYSAQ